MSNYDSLFNNGTSPEILVVDDVPENIETIVDILALESFKIITATDGREALQRIEENAPDLILLDAIMPGMDGFEVARIVKNNQATRLIPIIMVTALDGHEDRIKGLKSGVDDFLTKPVNVVEMRARIKNLLSLRAYVSELENAEQVIFSLARAVEAKDKYTEGHCGRLAFMAEELGRRLELSPSDLVILRRGGILHDIGKIAIEDSILLKPGALTKAEFDVIKSHPIRGEEICKPLKTMKAVLPVIRHHHERFDGSGYPQGLSGTDIPYHARIMGVVDCYDALVSQRPYRDALTPEAAINIIRRETEKGLWDPDIVSEFIRMVTSRYFSIAS